MAVGPGREAWLVENVAAGEAQHFLAMFVFTEADRTGWFFLGYMAAFRSPFLQIVERRILLQAFVGGQAPIIIARALLYGRQA